MPQLIGEVFPADKSVSRFLLSMAMARNDIEHAMWKAADANEAGRPEFDYWVRLVMGHFVEAAQALQLWRSRSKDVREFLNRLPATGKTALREVAGTLQKVGTKAVDHARNHTFHYPSPGGQYDSEAEVTRVLGALAEDPIELAEVEGRPGRARYVFADKAAIMIAMGKHSTEDRDAYRAQVMTLEEGAAAFVNFVGVAFEKAMDDAYEEPS
jgi:hypothetical protein